MYTWRILNCLENFSLIFSREKKELPIQTKNKTKTKHNRKLFAFRYWPLSWCQNMLLPSSLHCAITIHSTLIALLVIIIHSAKFLSSDVYTLCQLLVIRYHYSLYSMLWLVTYVQSIYRAVCLDCFLWVFSHPQIASSFRVLNKFFISTHSTHLSSFYFSLEIQSSGGHC